MRKLILSIALMLSFSTVAYAATGFEAKPNGSAVDVTFTFDDAAAQDSYGLLTVFNTEHSKKVLQEMSFEPDTLVHFYIAKISAKSTSLSYSIDMTGMKNGIYYLNFSHNGEVVRQPFSYMDADSLKIFMGDLKKINNTGDLYTFFNDNKLSLNIDLNDYINNGYTESEVKWALNNVLGKSYTDVLSIKDDYELGLIIAKINAADANGILSYLEANKEAFDLDTATFDTLGDAKLTVTGNMVGKSYKTQEEVKNAFEDETANVVLDEIIKKIEKEDTVILDLICDDENAKYLGIDLTDAIYEKYVKGDKTAVEMLESLLSGKRSALTDKDKIKKAFQDGCVITAYCLSTDYRDYPVIEDTKDYLGLSGEYFETTNTDELYTLHKKMINAIDDFNSIDSIVSVFEDAQDEIGTEDNEDDKKNNTTTRVDTSKVTFGTYTTTSVTEPEETQPVQSSRTFTDLLGFEWAVEYIYNLKDLGIINGRSDEIYSPGDLLKKEEAAKIVAIALELSDPNAQCYFTDVNQNEWYYEYVASLVNVEILNGIGDNMFGIGEVITREDMCTMIYRALKYNGITLPDYQDESRFRDDVYMAEYAKDAIYALRYAGVIDGVGDNMFEPKTPLNRAMAAKIVDLVLKLIK